MCAGKVLFPKKDSLSFVKLFLPWQLNHLEIQSQFYLPCLGMMFKKKRRVQQTSNSCSLAGETGTGRRE